MKANRRRVAPCLTLFLLLCHTPARAGDPSWYQKKPTWRGTMTASLTAIQAEAAKTGEGKSLRWYRWYESKPMKSDSLAKELAPETKGVDLKAREGKKKKSVWAAKSYADGVDHPLKIGANHVIYLCREITTKEPLSVPVYLAAEQEQLVRLNGKPVALKKGKSGFVEGLLSLTEGKNLLMVKIYCAETARPFYFSTMPERGLARPEDRFNELCSLIARDFTDADSTREIGWELADRIWSWNRTPDAPALVRMYARYVPKQHQDATKDMIKRSGEEDLKQVLAWYVQRKTSEEVMARARAINVDALGQSIEHMTKTFGARYPRGRAYLKELASLAHGLPAALEALESGDASAAEKVGALVRLEREALLANPLLDFEKLLIVKRAKSTKCLPANFHGNCALPRNGYDDSIETLDVRTGAMKPLYKPDRDAFVGDVDLDFDARRMLFSSLDENQRWQIYEIGADGRGLRQVTPGTETDVDNYDACYLPDGDIIFASTRCFAGVPCVGGKAQVANFFSMKRDGSGIRQLCFDQEHNLFPVVLPNGKVMYMRWEYTDTPHYFTRLIMTMNPDGTQQMAYYGSNSYWPTSLLMPRPVPGHPSKFVGIVSGHHGTRRSGELYVFDPAVGRHEVEGVVQQIPGRDKKVEPIIRDRLVDNSWPQFLHPYPLDENYLLVAAKMTKNDRWAIYLVDTFDNMLRLREAPGCDLYEPVPLRPTERPPVIPNKVDPEREDGVVYLVDVYKGPGLEGVPQGTVKGLRVFQWHYAYNQMGGHMAVSIEGGWDIKRILGTVPVEEDGSALFRVPANTPLAVQPVDAEGRAMQVMRSWFTAQRGEVLSCVGCHEPQNEAPVTTVTLASRRDPSEITPWLGPARGLSFIRDVQPVLDKRCVVCHDGSKPQLPNFKDTEKDLGFTKSYHALHPYVRRPGPESDYHIFRPMEYHASTSELIQMLEKGHNGVKLDEDEWSRLYTWIDLNAPDHGTWGEQRGESPFMARRAEMMRLYACVNTDPEAIPVAKAPVTPREPGPAPKPPAAAKLAGWPLSPAEATALQKRLGETEREVALDNGVKLALVRVPAGRFVMGDVNGFSDEWSQTAVTIDKPFWIGRLEVSNRQFAQFDPAHDSRYIDQQWKDHTGPGYPANEPDQPVIRVTWNQAMDFCRWLSSRTGTKFTLPTEAQWEYACRAGSATPLWYGDEETDFSKMENLADKSIVRLAVKGVNPKPVSNPNRTVDFVPRERRFDDKQMIATATGAYGANPWGLHDMHGNVAEWTLSDYRPYPYREDDGRNAGSEGTAKVMRGGSWRDRPAWARSSIRRHYQPWQPVYNGGFRVVMED